MKYVQTLPEANTNSDHDLLVAKTCTRLKKIVRLQKGKSRRALEKVQAQRQNVQDTPREKLGALECESRNMEVQWNNIKKCVLHTVND
jgi:hypothetical protein